MRLDGVHPRRKDEREYEREMRLRYLQPYLTAVAAALNEARPNSMSQWLAVVATQTAIFERDMLVRFPRDVVERWANRLNAYHANAFFRTMQRAAKVDVRPFMNDFAVRGILRDAVEENISLIRTIPERFKAGLADKVERAERVAPMDLQAAERLYRKEGRSAGYNLRRIVRDQSSKLSGKLSETRQTELGITEYKWSTSQDERVRPTHVTKEGMIFSWEKPPRDTGHPGEDIQCRCVAIPHITLESLQQRFGE